MTRSFSATLVLVILAAVGSSASAQEPNFGRAIAMSSQDLLIGQPVNWYGPGTVYAYRIRADGTWSEGATLTAPESAMKDDFGRAIALEGNTLVVGAPRKRDGDGVAYAFLRAAGSGSWELSGTIEPPRDGDHAEYAAALALTGDDLLVGSPAVESTGVVYHYRRGGGDWTLAGVIRPPQDPATKAFGAALSVDGDHLLVGAPGSDAGNGRVYVVERSATGDWGVPSALGLPDGPGDARDAVGSALSLEGRHAYVGAPGAGAVYVLEEMGDGAWSVTQTLDPGDVPGSAFGFSLAVTGDELLVGAPRQAASDGRVYHFTRDASGAFASRRRIDPDETEGASWPLGFGYAVAASGARATVGMPTRDFGEGRALTLDLGDDEWLPGDLLEGQIYRIGEELTSGDRCSEGRMGEFPCTNMELVGHMSVDNLGGERGVWVNDVWGWEDPDTGRQYALVARRDGTSFVDVTDPTSPRLVGNLPRTVGSRPSVWRDIKVIGSHAYIVSDGAGEHGMQVFDLTRLRDAAAPELFEPDTTYDEIHSAHNVVADAESGFLYIVAATGGGNTCGGGLHIVDARDPERPAFAGCYHDASAGGRGYTHDAQCLVYDGPDGNYTGREICVASNESELNIADVTDKSNPTTIARATYPNVAYAHQGWLDAEQRYFYMNDEGDEAAGNVERTRTLVWDLTELDDPVLVREYFAPVAASDHNLYVVGDRMYQSNYGSGLRVLDISDREAPREIAHFDSAPYNQDGPGFSATESGAWSNFPFFSNGLVIFTSVREGLLIMRVSPPVS